QRSGARRSLHSCPTRRSSDLPAAVIAAIAAFETARTSDDATREVFFNIRFSWLMYVIFAGSMAIILAALVQRVRIYRLGKPWKVDRKSTRLNSSHVKISYAVF